MIGGSDRQASPERTPLAPKPRRRAWPRFRVLAAAGGGAILASALLAACGTSSASTGPVTLQFYNFPDPSGAVQSAADNCSKASNGRYTIVYNKLQNAADQQRLQMARRLAAHDGSMDILGLDVTWEPEFATAGWIRPWTGQAKAAADRRHAQASALQTAIWRGQLVAVPYNSNTQLLWYRSDLVKTPPKTWAQMFSDAEALAKAGQASSHRDPGRPVRGHRRLVQHAGGQRGRQHPEPDLNRGPARRARGQGAVDHEDAGQLVGGRPVARGADGGPEPAGHGGRQRGVRAELPVRLSGHEGRQPEAVQGVQVGALSGGDPRDAGPR